MPVYLVNVRRFFAPTNTLNSLIANLLTQVFRQSHSQLNIFQTQVRTVFYVEIGNCTEIAIFIKIVNSGVFCIRIGNARPAMNSLSASSPINT